MRKVSIAISNQQKRYGDLNAIDVAKKIGVDAVDFNLSAPRYDYRVESSIYSKSDEEIFEYFKKIGDHARDIGIEIFMTHGRISTFKNIPENDAAVLKNARLDCLATKALGAKYCVMHGVTTCNFEENTPAEFMHDLNYSFFSQALKYAKEYDVMIATETFGDAPNKGCCDFFGNVSEFKKFYDRVQRECEYADHLVMCMDTGHCNKAMRFNNNPTPSDAIRYLGSNIKCLHLNDNDTFTDQHRMPGIGTIDWKDVLVALDEIGYDGVYNMELTLKLFGDDFADEYAAFAVKYLKHLLAAHYGEN